MRIAILTSDIMGPIRNGGVGTALYFLAHLLGNELGHEVTVYFMPEDFVDPEVFRNWCAFYEERNVRLVRIEEGADEFVTQRWASRSFQAYQFLRKEKFDVLHYPDMQGLAYYCLLAARQKSDFLNVSFVGHLHGPTRWHTEHSGWVISREREFALDFLEQESVALSDKVVAPSQYMLNWYRKAGWRLPESCTVIPHAPMPSLDQTGLSAMRVLEIREVAYVGRFETRKGLKEFTEACRLLPSHLQIRFIGKPGDIDGSSGLEWLEQQRPLLPQPNVSIETQWGHLELLNYFKTESPLVVMPSFAENAPCVLFECLSMGVPIVWSALGGGAEMVREDLRNSGLQAITPQEIAVAVEKRLSESGRESPWSVPKQAMALEWQQSLTHWRDFHRNLELSQPQRSPVWNVSGMGVSVLIASKSRPHFLSQALASLANQSHKNLEVLVWIDSGTTEELEAYQRVIRRYESRLGIVAHFAKEGVGPSVARNRLLEVAKHDRVMFMDDDNWIDPGHVEALLCAFEAQGVDAMSVPLQLEAASEHRSLNLRREPSVRTYLPLGPCLNLAPFFNVFGDTHGMYKKSALLSVKGFDEQLPFEEDWDLYWRLVLAGRSVSVCVNERAYYRNHRGQRSRQLRRSRFELPYPAQSFLKRELPGHARDLMHAYLANRVGTPRSDLDIYDEQLWSTFLPGLLDRIEHQELIQIQPAGQAIGVEGYASDPQFSASLDYPVEDDVDIRAVVEANQESTIQIYYQTLSRPEFCEEQVLSSSVSTGTNTLHFQINAKETLPLFRMDFGIQPGSYRILSLERRVRWRMGQMGRAQILVYPLRQGSLGDIKSHAIESSPCRGEVRLPLSMGCSAWLLDFQSDADFQIDLRVPRLASQSEIFSVRGFAGRGQWIIELEGYDVSNDRSAVASIGESSSGQFRWFWLETASSIRSGMA